MTLDISELNSVPPVLAADLFRSCCGSARWVEEMVARRPFASIDEVLMAADQAWASTHASDWREAFAHHPRIGEKHGVITQSARASTWSAGEQEGMSMSTTATRTELAKVNEEYERRFGHIYVVCATSMTSGELLAVAKERMKNDPEAELKAAAEEQRKITQLRLRKLLGDES